MSSIQSSLVKLFSQAEIRFVPDESGKFEFGIVADDLAKAIEHTNTSKMCDAVEEDYKGLTNDYSTSKITQVLVIWEPGIYQLLAKSRKSKVKPFQKWLFEEVLPEIRKTGQYNVNRVERSLLSEEKLKLIHLAIDGIFANVPIKPELVAGIKLNAVQRLFPELAPAIEESRNLLATNTAQEYELLTPTEIGKRLGLSAIKVNQLLIDKGLQEKNENRKSRKESAYLPTGKGLEFSDLTLSTGKGNDLTSYQQLRWYSSVLSQL